MASGFRNPWTTQAGRKVKLTEKARLTMVDNVWRAVAETTTVLGQSENQMMDAIVGLRSAKLVQALYDAWQVPRRELEDLTKEYWHLASPAEQDAREEDLKTWRRQIQATEDEVRRYLSSRPSPPVVKRKFEPAFVIKKEKQLAEEIKRIEKQISHLSVQTPDKKQVPPTPSASWVTTSRCPSDPPTRTSTADRQTPTVTAPVVTSVTAPPPSSEEKSDRRDKDFSNKLMDTLAGALADRREMLPRMEPEKFHGEMMKFPMWMNSFEALIERHTTYNQERLFFLGKYTGGEAHEAISGYLTLFAEDAYARAKKLLKSRYGDKLKVAQSYRNKLFSWATVKKNDGVALQQYADFLWQCNAAMNSVGHLESLNSAEENARMVKVLPQYIVDKWFRVVDRWYHRGGETDHLDLCEDEEDEQPMFPPFEEFCRLVSTEARIVNGPAFKLFNQSSVEKPKVEPAKPAAARSNRRAQSFASAAAPQKGNADEKPKIVPSCFYCKDAHFLSTCASFMKLPAAQRKDFASENHLCFGCLGRGHGFRSCRWKKPELLRDTDTTEVKATTMNTQVEGKVLSRRGAFFSMIVPVRVKASRDSQRSTVVYALLDTQSDTTFLSEELIEKLNLPSTDVKLHLVTMGSSQTVPSQRVNDLFVEDVFGDGSLVIEESYSRVLIPASREQLPDQRVAEMYEHLRPMVPEMLNASQSVPISLLIGNDQPAAFICQQMLYLNDDVPYGVRTKLGWTMMGRADVSRQDEARCFSTSARVVNVSEIAKVFDLEFVDVKPTEQTMSYEDQLFIQKARESICRTPDGRLCMDLPFREEPAIVPYNKDIAMKRLMSVKRKMLADDEYRRMYCKFMNDLLKLGYAEKAPEKTVTGRVQFMPHHAVVHPRKPGEVRGVFDAAAEKMGISLNKLLLPGPDMTNNLLGVLCGFRRERVAFMCDVRKMFMQVGVSEHHRDYLRYLWFANDDPRGEVIEYRMKVLSFGATSSPACASYAFKELATLHEEEYDREVVQFIREKFYVDDGLSATETAEATVKLFMDSHDLCNKGGFWLHKFTSNSEEALRLVPPELLAAGVKEWLLNPTVQGVESTLGITWDRVKDVFRFVIQEFAGQLTRRGMLSSLSGVYDPIGFLSPVVLVGRLLLQELCGQSLPWDAPLDEEYVQRWRAWHADLTALSRYTIPRCVRLKTRGAIVRAEMHHFCDASSRGYGACSYLRLEDENGRVDVSLVLAKARVGPKKAVTIPRMELQSAVLAVKLATFLSHEMRYEDLQHWFWTDSMVVLGYVSNPAKRFHIYVANRVQKIRDQSDVTHWSHVAGELNPADAASRGVTAHELMNHPAWLTGPSFLKMTTALSPPIDLPDDDPEIRRAAQVLATSTEPSWIETIACRVTSLYKLTYCVAVMMKFISYLADRRKQKRPTRADLTAAVVKIVGLSQQRDFADELTELKRYAGGPSERSDVRDRNRLLRACSRLKRLDVFVDDLGLIRVGGRLRRAYLPVDIKHPMIVPRSGRVTELLVLSAHRRAHHAGRQQTLAALRCDGFWVLHARGAVDEVIRKCVTCKKLKAAPMVQKMSDLPASRVEESPPFTFCGVDLFGPVVIKEGRSLKKRWICLITCMASRAVHLEPVYSLSTDSFLNALRRLIARRGPVQQIYCDQGTNFVGASREMRACMEEMDEDVLKRELLKTGCDWVAFKFNPPTASHMGGVWERMVKSAKSVLLHLLTQYGERVSDEMLWTLTAEVEGMLNNRPISCVDVQDPWGEPPLTPARLLTQKYRGMSRPPGQFEDVEVYGKKTWRRVQNLADRFWRQWRVEFLPDLQLRRKWNNRQFNLKVGDIVLMVDKDLKRNQWPMARVTEPITSEDGLVRSVRLRVGHSTMERPIAKLVFLCSGEE